MARGEKGRERVNRADPVEPQFHQTGEAIATERNGARAGSYPSAYAETPSARQGKTGRWRLSNWRLRTKLLAVLLIPSVAAAIFGGLRVADGLSHVSSLTGIGEEINLQAPAGRVIQELQRERDLSVAYVASRKSIDSGPLRQQRQKVDGTIAEFRTAVDSSSQAVGQPYRTAARDLDVLNTVRDAVDKTAYPGEDVTRSYQDRIKSLMDLTQQGISHIRDPGLLRLSLATHALANAQEAQSLKRAELSAVLYSGNFGPDQVRHLMAVEAELESAVNDFRTWATPQQAQRYDDTVTGLQVDNARHIEEYALSLYTAGKPVVLNPADWDSAASETVNLISRVQGDMQGELRKQHSELASQANQDIILASSATIAALVLAFAIALLVARSLLLPLRTLRRSALDIADKRLPAAVESILHESNPDMAARARVAPIPVHTTEEIGRVARSFDAVHSQALRLASEQAFLRNNVNDLFVNLARRSQTLVQRQLALIDNLEQDEQDPDQLSSLFELDHLATRMRRNNENLLILGGTDLTRRMMPPVPLSEVLGAAVSEVEQYTRVAVAETPELAIQGRVVNDLVHLVAELLENATVFSNPDTEVNIRTAYRRQELVIEIRDRGVGIDDAELGEINERLLRPPDVDVAVSRRMGLYVVGQLARRYNVRVRLHNNDDLEGGITSTVRVSGEYVAQLTADGPMPMPDIRPADGQRDSLSETGTHLGLAAAFGRGGVADRGQHETAERAAIPFDGTDSFGRQDTSGELRPVQGEFAQAEHAQLANETEDPTEFHILPGSDEISDHEGGLSSGRKDELAAPFAVQLSSAESFGAADVPHWDSQQDTGGFHTAWPSEELSQYQEVGVHDGQTGAQYAAPAEDDDNDLFHNPLESEKTAFIEQSSLSGLNNWGAGTPGQNPAETSQPLPAVNNHDPQHAPLGASRPAGHVDDAPTERLPIYEAVLSQWFRESDEPGAASSGAKNSVLEPDLASSRMFGSDSTGLPASSSAEQDQQYEPAEYEPGEAETELAEAEPARTGPNPNGSAPVGTTAAGLPKRAPRAGRSAEQPAESPQEQLSDELPEPVAAEANQAHRPSQQAKPEDPGWGSADPGWQAAEAVVEQSQNVQETTSAGLPKRVPKSNLVPGSAAPKPSSSAPRKPAAPRSADAVRGRMSNFQQGIRRGRHHKVEPASTEQSRSIPSRHEEQE